MPSLNRFAWALALLPVCAIARADETEFHLVIAEHRFSPVELVVPADRKLRLIIDNHDATAEEFESYALNREKVVPAARSIVIYVGPLRPGRYEFFGDFNPASARGWLVVKP